MQPEGDKKLEAKTQLEVHQIRQEIQLEIAAVSVFETNGTKISVLGRELQFISTSTGRGKQLFILGCTPQTPGLELQARPIIPRDPISKR